MKSKEEQSEETTIRGDDDMVIACDCREKWPRAARGGEEIDLRRRLNREREKRERAEGMPTALGGMDGGGGGVDLTNRL